MGMESLRPSSLRQRVCPRGSNGYYPSLYRRRTKRITVFRVEAHMQFIDEGQWEGTRLFQTEAQVALQLMQSLSPELQEQVRIYKKMHDPAMPEGRWHPADE